MGSEMCIRDRIVTGSTKVKARVVTEEAEAEEEDSKILKNQELDVALGNHLEPIPRSSLCQGRGCWALTWAKLLLRTHLYH